ncbi:anti-sigma factor RsiW [Melghiribacillus thermohalophilus]|uniref:Anti-sigma-W factor RsiW n=1 Tax=Melghiribacillus thermohalophilus TaxID=1324956 RepID=A0A4R3MRV4_9BACI|nr:zf-HC2 domain-containing protein [Melghiribacillus thermohalophilus]TCT17243.1 anti-sigma factor RsiW [Melghiribacillus thermohalophilus]
MKCPKEIVKLMHKYLDHEISKKEEVALKEHLTTCENCQKHFHELKRTEAMLQNTTHLHLSEQFTKNVMANLPREKKRIGFERWLKSHPFFTAAAIFFFLMFTSAVTMWNQDEELRVSIKENIVIQDNTVIVPEGEVIEGDLVVQNGDLKIEGKVKGDVILINGELLNGQMSDSSKYLASAGEVTGDIEQVNQVFEWIWYKIKHGVKQVIPF